MLKLYKILIPGILLLSASTQLSAQDGNGEAALDEQQRAQIEQRREEIRERREANRGERRERWESMSEDERHAAIERRRERAQARPPRQGHRPLCKNPGQNPTPAPGS